MKKVSLITIALVSLLVCSCSGDVQKEESSVDDFTELADEEGFAEKHDEPKEVEIELKGEMVELAIEGGELSRMYSRKKEGSNIYLIIIHEWWGLNDQIKLEADRLYDKFGNVNVLALDLYDGGLATTREKAMELMKGTEEERIHEIIDATIASLPEAAEVATIGWCFGGGWSLRAALRAKERTKAAVIYYGMPLEDVDELKELNSDVLFIYGIYDEWISRGIVETFYDKMEEAGKKLQVKAYKADHAFANPSSDRYIEEEAQKANEAAFNYLKERLN